MSSLPAAVQKVLAEADCMRFFKSAASGRVECTLNGHSIPVENISALETFVGGKKFKKLVGSHKQVSDLKKFEPFLVPSKRLEGHLFCSLTSQLVKADMHNAKKHISGTRFLLAKERFMKDEADIIEEPTADTQTAKPIRRAHCKSQATADMRRSSVGREGEEDDSSDVSEMFEGVSQGGSDRSGDPTATPSSSESLSGEQNGEACSESGSEDAAEMANLNISTSKGDIRDKHNNKAHAKAQKRKHVSGECRKDNSNNVKKPCKAAKPQKLSGKVAKAAHAHVDECEKEAPELLGRLGQAKSANQSSSTLKGGKGACRQGENEKQSLHTHAGKGREVVGKHSAGKTKKAGKKSCELVTDAVQPAQKQKEEDASRRFQKRGRAGESQVGKGKKKAKKA